MKFNKIIKDKYLLFTIKYFWKYFNHLSYVFIKHSKQILGVGESNLKENKNHNTITKKINDNSYEDKQLNLNGFFLRQIPNLRLQLSDTSVKSDYINILLATKKHLFDKIDFDKRYNDQEDYFFVNRFRWLYEILLEYPSLDNIRKSIKTIESWITNNRNISDDPKFESYSISERIISWIFFLMFIKNNIEDYEIDFDLITKSIEDQTHHLINNLEFNGEFTNNHILNNARAIYIVGKVFENTYISKLGVDIFHSEYSNLIKSGVLLEGSSHYQVMITKNFLETCLIADSYGDKEFKNFLQISIDQMLGVCNNLFGNYSDETFPFFGDISPDISPEWLYGYPFNNNSTPSKWFTLFYNVPVSKRNKILSNKIIEHEKQSLNWMKIDGCELEVWINKRSGQIPCHGHNDNGTIAIFYRGVPVVVDLGICSYLNTEANWIQKSAEAHNMPVINGYSVDIPEESLVYGVGLTSENKILYSDIKSVKYSVIYANSKIEVIRTIKLDNYQCTIHDQVFSNNKKVCYSTNWHLNGKLERNKKKIFHYDNWSFTFENDLNTPRKEETKFCMSEKYGENKPVFTINVNGTVNSHSKILTTLSFKND
jgi:hypothetical protein